MGRLRSLVRHVLNWRCGNSLGMVGVLKYPRSIVFPFDLRQVVKVVPLSPVSNVVVGGGGEVPLPL